MKRQILLTSALLFLLGVAHVVFNKWEARQTQPHRFVFDLKHEGYPKIRADEIGRVIVAGSFNAWGSFQTIDSMFYGVQGWPLEKVGPERWELIAHIPVMPGTLKHEYKFRVLPKSVETFKRLNMQPDAAGIWLPDTQNPNMNYDGFGGYNSVIDVRDIAPLIQIARIAVTLIIALVILTPLVQIGIQKLLRMKIAFASKILILSFCSVLFASGVALSLGTWTSYKLLFQRDSETAHLLIDIFKLDIGMALFRNTPPPSNWREIVPEDNFSRLLRMVSSRETGLKSIYLFSSTGRLLKLALSEYEGAAWNYTPGFAENSYRAMTSLETSPIFKLKEPAYVSIGDTASIDTGFAARMASYLGRKLGLSVSGPFHYFLYPIKSYRVDPPGFLLLIFADGTSGAPARLETVRGLAMFSALVISVSLVLIMIGASIFGRFLLDPIQRLTAGFRSISKGDYSTRIQIATGDELSECGDVFNDMARGLKERELIRETFGRYVSHQVAEQILKDPDAQKMGGERREVTLLFSDIRGFTSFAERHSPEEVVSTLNEYFGIFVEIIFKHQGTVDKFIGDCIMAMFGAPLDQTDHPLRAVKSALEMRQAIEEINSRRRAEGKEPIIMGIGVNTGEAIVGNVGSPQRTEYSAIGDTVNVAARLESASRTGQVLVGKNTFERIKEFVDARPIGPVSIKGRAEPVEVFEISALRPT